jgi:hypothetical protein
VPKSDGWWKPGQSGNPGGRPKNRGSAAEEARKHAVPVIFSILQQTTDRRIPARERRAAAKILLRLGFGRNGDIGQQLIRSVGWHGAIDALNQAAIEDERQALRQGDTERELAVHGLVDGPHPERRGRTPQPTSNWQRAARMHTCAR